MKFKQFLAAALIVSLIPVAPMTVFAEDKYETEQLEESSEEDNGIALETMTEVEFSSLPAELNIEKVETFQNGGLITVDSESSVNSLQATATQSLPSSYNTDLDNLSYVTSVKNQDPYNTCWAFTCTSVMESLLMKTLGVETLDDETGYNFSEFHAILALSNQFLKDGTYGFTGSEPLGGGNQTNYAMYATRAADDNTFTGPVLEECMPYSKASSSSGFTSSDMDLDTIGYYFSLYSEVYLEGEYLSDDDIDARNEYIKQKVLEYGSVSISIRCGSTSSDSTQGFQISSSVDTVFYQNNVNVNKLSSLAANHGVTIVGYDDNYSKDNFSGFSGYLSEGDGTSIYPSTPSTDGAFIVKNSWVPLILEQTADIFICPTELIFLG